MKRTFFLLAVIFTVACGTAKVASTASAGMTQSDADRAAAIFPGTSLADLNKGKTNYEAHCGKCHGLKAINSKDEAGWRKIVPPMAKKANIDAATEESILKYTVTMCSVK